MLYTVPPKVRSAVSALPRVSVPLTPSAVTVPLPSLAPILPLIVIFPSISAASPVPVPELTVKLFKAVAVVNPTDAILTFPFPESIVKFSAVASLASVSPTPLILEPKVTAASPLLVVIEILELSAMITPLLNVIPVPASDVIMLSFKVMPPFAVAVIPAI